LLFEHSIIEWKADIVFCCFNCKDNKINSAVKLSKRSIDIIRFFKILLPSLNDFFDMTADFFNAGGLLMLAILVLLHDFILQIYISLQ